MGTASRFAKTLRADPQPAGRTTVDVECPFCQCVTQARVWSLAGSGKRCAGGCGALLSGKGIGMTVATRTAGREFAQCSTCQGGPVCYCTDTGCPTSPGSGDPS